MVHGHEEYVVEDILSHRFTGRSKKLQFLVKWAGYGTEENMWCDEDDLTADGTIQNQKILDYWQKLASIPGAHIATSGPTVTSHKAVKYTPKNKLVKPTVAKVATSKRLAAVAVEAPAKRRKYPTRSKGGGV
jgi:hypothetical protein